MDSGHGKMRMNVEGDRLSSLPDDLVHRILSSFNIKDVIGLSVLSSRWRFIWTSLPYLNLATEDFSMLPNFSKFVTNVLSRRNKLTDVYSMKLSIRVNESLLFLKRILKYALSHHIQQLDVVCLLEKGIEFPLSLFSSETIKHLSVKMGISGSRRYIDRDCYLTSTWELPLLTTLHLDSVFLCYVEADKCVGFFSKCANLQNLILSGFKTKGSNGFSIIHPRLSNLTLEYGHYSVNVVNVAAPQLKNLTIRDCFAKHVISAPELSSLFYKGDRPLCLSTEGFHSLEKADICVSYPDDKDVPQIIYLLQELHNVKFLTLSLEIIEILSSSVDLILQQPSPFVNLTNLKIYPQNLHLRRHAPQKVTIMSTELKSYLLDSSPKSTFTMVLREEVKAKKIMAELRVILEKEKDIMMSKESHLEQGKTQVKSNKPNSKTKLKTVGKVHLEREKAQMESHEPKEKSKGNMAQIKIGWENLVVQLQQRKEKACLIISKLQDIEELMKKLPASNRANIQPCFSILCAEADIVIGKITDCMKIKCDENRSLSSVHFHELATTVESSS